MPVRNTDKIFLYGQFHEKLTYRKLFFVLFNLKNPGIQVKIILATGQFSKGRFFDPAFRALGCRARRKLM